MGLNTKSRSILLTGILLCSTGWGQGGKNRVMIARVDCGLRIAIAQDFVHLRPGDGARGTRAEGTYPSQQSCQDP